VLTNLKQEHMWNNKCVNTTYNILVSLWYTIYVTFKQEIQEQVTARVELQRK